MNTMIIGLIKILFSVSKRNFGRLDCAFSACTRFLTFQLGTATPRIPVSVLSLGHCSLPNHTSSGSHSEV